MNGYVQTFSFEGDSTGKKLVRELGDAGIPDVKILVDSFTKYVINDLFIYGPANLFNRELQAEVKETGAMIEGAKQRGMQIRFMNPVGFLFHKFPQRNHKKLVLIDDRIVYFGGMNFSDHNFDWHDMMIRIEDPKIAAFFKEDFLSDWDGINKKSSAVFNDTEIYVTDGKSNEESFEPVIKLIQGAKKSIVVESPYLAFPFYEHLEKAASGGVKVTIISPEHNNSNNIKKLAISESAANGFDLYMYQNRMTHLKAILIDDEVLVAGSSNFDYLSYVLHQENIIIIRNKDFIADFKKRVIERDISESVFYKGSCNKLAAFIRKKKLIFAGKAAVFLARI